MTPAQRTLRAKIAAHTSWANTADRAARTAAARKAAHDRFADQVDPEGVLAPEERARRAENARKAYYFPAGDAQGTGATSAGTRLDGMR